MKKCIYIFARKLFLTGLRPYTENEKRGIKLAFQFLLKHPGALSVMLITGLIAAVFEGGTLGILGLAVGVLTGESAGMPLQVPEFLARQIDVYFGSISRGGIFLLLVGIAVAAQIVKGALLYVSTVATINLSFGMQRDAQDKATHHVMTMTYSQVGRYPSGELVSLVDQSGIVSNIVSEIGKASRALLMVASYVTVMLFMSLVLTISSLIIFGILLISLNQIVKTLKRLSRETFVAAIDTTRWAVEFIGAPRLLRIFSGTEKAEVIVKEARYRRVAADRKAATLIALIIPAFEVITVLGAGLFLIVGYVLAGESAIRVVPALFVFVLVFFRLKPQIKLLNDLRISFAKLLPQLEIIGEFFRDECTDNTKVGALRFRRLEKKIEFFDVGFSHEGSEPKTIDGLNLVIERGETVALVGPSGAGKSTVVDLLLGLYVPDSGQILIDETDLSMLNIDDWRKSIGVVDQDVFLLNADIESNINFGNFFDNQYSIEEAAKIAHADGFIRALDKGYKTVIGDRGHKLSGGEQQRLALARALARQPDILILDEATSSLDSFSERLIQSSIESMHEKCTILVIAHRLATVVNADRIVVLDHGRIVESGTKEELLQMDGQFSKLWRIQNDIRAK